MATAWTSSPSKTAYAAGDTARFQVRMPFREATALVTVEREGVLSSFVTELSGKDPVVEVKLPGSYAPDVFVSVMAVRGRVERGWRIWLAEHRAEPGPRHGSARRRRSRPRSSISPSRATASASPR